MTSGGALVWTNPEDRVWGFHVHQEVPEADLPLSLVVQTQAKRYLSTRGVRVDHEDVIRPGYGPHLDNMWELRVESIAEREDVLRHLGASIGFIALNRGLLPAYVHPLMHDPTLPDVEQLRQEGETNQREAIWFGKRVAQQQDFFFNPPLGPDGRVVDTRTSRLYSEAEKEAILAQGTAQAAALGKSVETYDDPAGRVRGYHIHLDYLPGEEEKAFAVFDHFIAYLLARKLRPSSTRIYAPKENGPHNQAGWEVKFEFPELDPAKTTEIIGIPIAWLMCNRQGMTVFLHCVAWVEGDLPEELRSHTDYSFFLGDLPSLDMGFFEALIEKERRISSLLKQA